MSKKNIQVRKGQAPDELSREQFRKRFLQKFSDPAFGTEASALQRIEVIAWDAYTNHRKAPLTHPAGRGYANPSYDLSDEWRAAQRGDPHCRETAERPGVTVAGTGDQRC